MDEMGPVDHQHEEDYNHGTCQITTKVGKLNVQLDTDSTEVVEVVETMKYLGIVLERTLSFDARVPEDAIIQTALTRR